MTHGRPSPLCWLPGGIPIFFKPYLHIALALIPIGGQQETKEKLAGEFSSDAILEDTCNAYLIALVNETVPESGPSSDWSVVKCLVIRRSSSDNPRYCRIGLVSMLALDWFGDAVWQSKRMAKWYHTLRPFKETLARVGPQLDHQNQAGLALDDWSADVPPLSRLEEKAANLEWGTVTIE